MSIHGASIETVLIFDAVRYICFDAPSKKDQLWYMNLTTDSYPWFLVKKLKVNILICMHIHTQKKPIDSEQRKENKADDS